MYQEALSYYQRNEFEKALDILSSCPKSPQVNALYDECIRSLSQQYKYLLDDARNNGNCQQFNLILEKYQKYIGQDDYLLGLVADSQEIKTTKKSQGDSSTYIVVFIIVLAISVIGGLVFYSKNNTIDQVPLMQDTIDTAPPYQEVNNDVEYEQEDNKSEGDAINCVISFYRKITEGNYSYVKNYLSKDFLALMTAYDRQEEIERQKGSLMPGDFIDWNIYTCAQDEVGYPCTADAISTSGDSMRLKVNFCSDNEEFVHTIFVDLVFEDNSWKIDDIYSENSSQGAKYNLNYFLNSWK